eukprot:g6036.t1
MRKWNRWKQIFSLLILSLSFKCVNSLLLRGRLQGDDDQRYEGSVLPPRMYVEATRGMPFPGTMKGPPLGMQGTPVTLDDILATKKPGFDSNRAKEKKGKWSKGKGYISFPYGVQTAKDPNEPNGRLTQVPWHLYSGAKVSSNNHPLDLYTLLSQYTGKKSKGGGPATQGKPETYKGWDTISPDKEPIVPQTPSNAKEEEKKRNAIANFVLQHQNMLQGALVSKPPQPIIVAAPLTN